MTPYQTMEQIDEAMERWINLRDKYLRKSGWDHVCNTPGSYWMWVKLIDGRLYACSTEHAYSMQKELDFREMNKPHDFLLDDKTKACAICGAVDGEYESPHQEQANV